MKACLPLFIALTTFSGILAVEVQSHGLLFERWLCDTFFDGYQPPHYTQKWDIPAQVNRLHGGIPVNPKAIKLGTPIGLGDALRQFEIDEPFLLIVGFWDQVSPDRKRWVNAQAVQIEAAAWKDLWGDVTRADLERLDGVIKDRSLSLEQARTHAQAIKNEAPFTSAVIQLNPKIDRSQRRLQCSLRFHDFFERLAPEASREAQDQPRLFDVALPPAFPSAPRVFSTDTRP